ncbi:MAG: flavodoxin [Acholeplasmataceae bacterium]|nr:flavodoxin [Acholeplasmataceae bacterium]
MNQNSHVKTLLFVSSYHHNNTQKIAEAFSSVLHAHIKTPEEIGSIHLSTYDLIGFGSGIDSGKHYPSLIRLANQLPKAKDKPGFIFSTSGIQGKTKVSKDHAILRTILISKGYIILDEFSCKGYNTNSFLKYFGGMNKGKPDANDIKNAEAFAKHLLQHSCFSSIKK